ncbi:DUF3368 domain-containing protein [Halomonas sp. BC2]|uniref:DUF3368 domain-containing protein n=1 Tax=Halomonas sp. BC2 TaxID=1670449 RepID=UPI0009BCCE89|nr:DUF3368 domain-containing protein [Halomonas sp. BC2]
MLLLVSDANILIDIEEGGLLEMVFLLPYQFVTPDILYYEELEDQHGHLLERGLQLLELSPDSMQYAGVLIDRYRGPSTHDCFALALASQEHCPLLTGDQALRNAAIEEQLEVMGTLWLVEELVRQGVINVMRAHQAYDAMQAAGRRLPWAVAKARLAKL